METVALKVNNLYAHYKTRFGEKIFAVDGVSLELKKNQVLGIAGESGCGKSTLANCLMGCFFSPLAYESGELIIDGVNVLSLDPETFRKEILGKKIAYIPQAAMNTLNPTLKIKNFIIDVMKEHHPEWKKAHILKLAEERFISLGLDPKILNAYPNELSGGMKQRTVIAISTILNPKVLVADEPTSALDVTSQKKVIHLLKKLLKEGFVESVVFITHELPLLFHVANDIAVMYAGQIVERGTSEEIIFKSVHPYSKALMGSIIVPELEMKNHKLFAIPGAPPNLKEKLFGCRFYDRCSERTDECKAADVPLRQNGQREHRCIKY